MARRRFEPHLVGEGIVIGHEGGQTRLDKLHGIVHVFTVQNQPGVRLALARPGTPGYGKISRHTQTLLQG
jgi:hypothetical protein